LLTAIKTQFLNETFGASFEQEELKLREKKNCFPLFSSFTLALNASFSILEHGMHNNFQCFSGPSELAVE
jgi:hypothetical protein